MSERYEAGNWNHRVIKHRDGSMEIAEVIYGLGGPDSYGWADATVYAEADEGMESIREQLDWMRDALDKPALDAIGCEKTCCTQPDKPCSECKGYGWPNYSDTEHPCSKCDGSGLQPQGGQQE